MFPRNVASHKIYKTVFFMVTIAKTSNPTVIEFYEFPIMQMNFMFQKINHNLKIYAHWL
jgi:hypothetical protein